MRKPARTNYGREAKRYITRTLAKPGETQKRGQLVRKKPREQTLEKLHIAFLPDGRVRLPHYSRTPGTDELVLTGYSVHRNPVEAIVYIGEQMNEMKREGSAINALSLEVAGTHADIVDHWKSYGATQRNGIVQLVEGFAAAIGKQHRLKIDHKKNAIARLKKAAEFLREGKNIPAERLLIGVSNDLIARENEHIKVRGGYLPRRKELISTRATEHWTRLEQYVTDTLERMDQVRETTVTREKLESILSGMRRDYERMPKKIEEEVKGPARAILADAGKAMKTGNFNYAHSRLRDFNRVIIRALSRRYLISQKILPIVQYSEYPDHRRIIFSQQLQLLTQSVRHLYFQAPTQKSPELVAAHLDAFVKAAEKDLPKRAVGLIRWAAQAAREKNPAIMVNRMQHAAEGID